MQKKNWSVSNAAITTLIVSFVSVGMGASAYAQVKVDVPGVAVSVDEKGVSVKAPGVDIKVDEPKSSGKSSTKSISTDTNKTSTGGKCIKGELRVASSGSSDASYGTLECDRVSVYVSGSANMSIGAIVATNVMIKIRGAGDLNIKRLSTSNLDVDNVASGKVAIAEGGATSARLILKGSGDFVAPSVAVETMAVQLDGSSSALVSASNSITGSISGAGDLKHSGGAKINVRTSGSGSVQPM